MLFGRGPRGDPGASLHALNACKPDPGCFLGGAFSFLCKLDPAFPYCVNLIRDAFWGPSLYCVNLIRDAFWEPSPYCENLIRDAFWEPSPYCENLIRDAFWEPSPYCEQRALKGAGAA